MTALLNTAAPDLSESDFGRFRYFFCRKTGIMFADNKRYFVDEHLHERMIASGHVHFRDYFNTLRFQASGRNSRRSST